MTTSCMQHAWECTSTTVHDFAITIVDTATHAALSTQDFVERCRPGFIDGLNRIQKTALPVLAFIAGAILFTAQSSVFGIGFLVSIMNPRIMHGSLDRIAAIWGQQQPFIRCVIIAGAAIAWPISLAASAFFLGGHLGVSLLPEGEQYAIHGAGER